MLCHALLTFMSPVLCRVVPLWPEFLVLCCVLPSWPVCLGAVFCFALLSSRSLVLCWVVPCYPACPGPMLFGALLACVSWSCVVYSLLACMSCS